jgi:hypothetical protein
MAFLHRVVLEILFQDEMGHLVRLKKQCFRLQLDQVSVGVD